jgi:hypothetical protein
MASTTPQPPAPPAPTNPPQGPPTAQPQPGAPAKKGTSPIVWVLAGCGGLIVIAVIVVLGAGLFVAHKAKGFAELAEKNPAMAIAKAAVAVNPDIEIVSEDDDKGIITVRNKKTGEEITMNAEDIKAGKLKFKNEKGEEVTLEGHGEKGKEGFSIKSDKGEMSFGAGKAQPLPAWVPSYPGVTPTASMKKSGADGLYGSVSFETEDDGAKVLDFYERELKGAGFTVERTGMSGAAMTVGNLNAKRDGGKRVVNVTAVRTDEGAQVTVQYSTSGGETE